jgi:hypothetical protein
MNYLIVKNLTTNLTNFLFDILIHFPKNICCKTEMSQVYDKDCEMQVRVVCGKKIIHRR